ncbi:MAG: response regulator [Chloroflexi bacterium]|nr:MAG: response regulator [Chloroflexota bacterium]
MATPAARPTVEAMSRILVAEDDADVADAVRLSLEDAGHCCAIARDGAAALEMARTETPDLLVLDLAMPKVSGDEVLAHLRADPRTRYVPAIILTAQTGARETVIRLTAGADDYVTKPFDIDVLEARVARALTRAAELRALNPLSGLPGNRAITDEIEARLDRRDPFACLWVDVNAFKSFNDHYGFARGDVLIERLAAILTTIARDERDAFLGHVGGDDFVLLTSPERAEAVASHAIDDFDREVGTLYDPADRARGHLEATDRRGRPRRTALATLSIGIVRADAGRFATATELSRAAAEVKEVAKRQPGSGWAVDRRRAPTKVSG